MTPAQYACNYDYHLIMQDGEKYSESKLDNMKKAANISRLFMKQLIALSTDFFSFSLIERSHQLERPLLTMFFKHQ